MLVTEHQQDVDALCLMPFDPTLVFSGSKDRLVASLLLTCIVLTRHRLLANDFGSTVLLQYSKVSAYFRQKWLSQSNEVPVIDDIFNLWVSYPYWQRCAELLDVIHLVQWCHT